MDSRLPITVLVGLRRAVARLADELNRVGPEGMKVLAATPDIHARIHEITHHGVAPQVLVHAGATADPFDVLAVLLGGDQGAHLRGEARVDAVVVGVDPECFVDDYASGDQLAERGLASGAADDRSVSELLAAQVEGADVIALLDGASMSTEDRRMLRATLRCLNAEASIVSIDNALGTGAFSLQRGETAPVWARALSGRPSPRAASEGVHAFVYRARRPFHPRRFQAFLETEWPGVIRARGRFWLASRIAWVGALSQAGAAVRTNGAGLWWAAIPQERWPEDGPERAAITAVWDPQVGDCRQELAFVGWQHDRKWLRAQLDACLISDREMTMGPVGWQALPDDFPVWELPDA